MRIALVAGLAALLGTAVPASAEHLYPRNECTDLAGYKAFERQLVTAVANRYAPMLKPLVDPEISLNFGGGYGWDEFVRRLDDPERDLWSELAATVALGCASDSDREFAYPWLWSQNLELDDPFSAFVTLGDRVPLRREASDDAPIIRYMNWEAVLLTGPYNGDQEFLQVRTRRGEQGFARFDQLRSEIDFRLLAFRNEDSGEWRITHFIAGD